MKIRKFTAAAVAAAMALAVAACSPPAEDDGDQESQASTSVNIGWNQPFYSYNENTSNGNATANAIVKYLMNTGFNYYNPDLELVPDESFGHYEKISDDPLTVKYTINEDVTWSDGTPVDAADMLLVWASQSQQLNTIGADEVKRDPDTNVPKAGDEVYFDSSSAGLSLVTQTPEISDDGQSLTLVYDKPFADWELDMGLNTINVPAHVTTMHALGIEDPQEAKDVFIKAVQERDNEKLAKIASFWNSGYDFTSLPEDESLYLSSGAYVMTDLVENQYVTLKAREDYSGDRPAQIDTVTIRWNEDPLAQAQALENGEIDLFAPQATTDVVEAVEGIEGVEVQTGVEGAYEHVDLTFDNGGPFDPASYGGDEEKALKVRQAFLHAVPRQEIVDKLIKPIQSDAATRDSFLMIPGAPGYDQMIAENGSQAYSEVDIAQSKQLLAEAGVQTPVDVRMMFAADNVRRANEFALIKESAKKAGFNVINKSTPEWGSKLGDGTYDAVFFAWQSTATGVSESQPTYVPNGINNLNGYANEQVTKLFSELIVTTDPEDQLALQIEIEKELWADAYGVTLFQFPAVAAWNTNRIQNVQPAPLSPTIFYGFWEWEVPSS